MGKMKENPRYNLVSCRLADTESEEFDKFVARSGKNRTQILRGMIQLATKHPMISRALIRGAA